MTQDDLAARVATLERRISDIDERGTRGLSRVESATARIEQRVTDLDIRVNSLAPMITLVATLTERVEGLRGDFAEFRQRSDARDADSREERRAVKIAIWTMTAMLVCALIGAAVVVATSVR